MPHTDTFLKLQENRKKTMFESFHIPGVCQFKGVEKNQQTVLIQQLICNPAKLPLTTQHSHRKAKPHEPRPLRQLLGNAHCV